MIKYKSDNLFFQRECIAWRFISRFEYPWEALDSIESFIMETGPSLAADEYEKAGDGIWISKSASVAPSAYIGGPCIIGPGAEVRHCAFIRRGALIGAGAVVGNSTEIKNAVLFDNSQVPHFNYVGDSVLGYRAHMGAGAVTSNVKSDSTPVAVYGDGFRIETGRKKLGAILGDMVEIGCGSVLNPGTVIGAETSVYPLSAVRGCVGPVNIYKGPNNIVRREGGAGRCAE